MTNVIPVIRAQTALVNGALISVPEEDVMVVAPDAEFGRRDHGLICGVGGRRPDGAPYEVLLVPGSDVHASIDAWLAGANL